MAQTMHVDPSHPIRAVCDPARLQKRAMGRKDFEGLIFDCPFGSSFSSSFGYLDHFMVLREQTDHQQLKRTTEAQESLPSHDR